MHEADDETALAAGGRPGGRSWWMWEDTEDTARPSKAKRYIDYSLSFSVISEALQLHSPVDGILGFSQGATIIALFLSELKQGHLQCNNLPDFAILTGGFMPRDPRLADAITQARPSMPSLHIYGRNDAFVRTISLPLA